MSVGHRAEVARALEPEPPGGARTDDEPVLVLRRRRLEHPELPLPQDRAQAAPHGSGVAQVDSGVGRRRLQRGPEVLRHHVDLALLQCRQDQLARPELQLASHRDARAFQSLRVDLGQQDALGEVERRDDDRVRPQCAAPPQPAGPAQEGSSTSTAAAVASAPERDVRWTGTIAPSWWSPCGHRNAAARDRARSARSSPRPSLRPWAVADGPPVSPLPCRAHLRRGAASRRPRWC